MEGAFIPLAGPFVTAVTLEKDSGIDLTPVLRTFYVAAGVGELAGFALAVAGLAIPAERKTTAVSPRVTITPIAGAGGGGLVAQGAF